MPGECVCVLVQQQNQHQLPPPSSHRRLAAQDGEFPFGMLGLEPTIGRAPTNKSACQAPPSDCTLPPSLPPPPRLCSCNFSKVHQSSDDSVTFNIHRVSCAT
ncbi:hypothetical protein TKK_0019322 [Trichogramma kaykai]